MEVFNKLNAVENEVFTEIQKIEKQIAEMKVNHTKLKDLAKVMNPERLKEKNQKVVKK